jgi:hypothetical protein
MPKPADNILITALDPSEELAARLAFCLINPWCRHDPVWKRRVKKLSSDLIRTKADRVRFSRRSRRMAHDIKNVQRLLKAAPATVLDR